MLDRQLKISEETEKLYEESYETTQALYQAGTYNSPAVYEMQASLESLRANILDLRNSIVSTEAALCLLLVEPPHHIERSTFEQFEKPEQIHIGLPVRLLDARPDVRMAERNVEMAYYGTQQARQSFYPSLSIDGLIGYAGTFNALGLIAEAVGSLAQPIFQGGQLKAQLRNAKAEQEKARLQFANTLYSAGNEVYKYKKACETAEEKSGHIDIRVNALQEAYNATTELMNHGSTTYLEVLTAQESLLSAQLAQVKNQYEMVQALINLYTALGGFGK
jgi:outer membrane protein TolC